MKLEFEICEGIADSLNRFFKDNKSIRIDLCNTCKRKLFVRCTEKKEKRSLWKRFRLKKKVRYVAVNLSNQWKTGNEYACCQQIQMKVVCEILSKEGIHVAIFETLE